MTGAKPPLKEAVDGRLFSDPQGFREWMCDTCKVISAIPWCEKCERWRIPYDVWKRLRFCQLHHDPHSECSAAASCRHQGDPTVACVAVTP